KPTFRSLMSKLPKEITRTSQQISLPVILRPLERLNRLATPYSYRSTCDCRLWTTSQCAQQQARTARVLDITCRRDSLPPFCQRCGPSDRATRAWPLEYCESTSPMSACPFRISRARDYFRVD